MSKQENIREYYLGPNFILEVGGGVLLRNEQNGNVCQLSPHDAKKVREAIKILEMAHTVVEDPDDPMPLG